MSVPEFCIAQNDKTKRTMIWANDKWTELPKSDYEIAAIIARLLRTSPEPNKVLQEIKHFNDWA